MVAVGDTLSRPAISRSAPRGIGTLPHVAWCRRSSAIPGWPRVQLRVPSVRGSSGSGHTTAAGSSGNRRAADSRPARHASGLMPGRRQGPRGRVPAAASGCRHRRPPSRARRRAAFSPRSTSSGRRSAPRASRSFPFAAADEHLGRPDRSADIAGVKPAVFERLRPFRRALKVACVTIAAHEDLAVLGDLHLHTLDGLARPTRVWSRTDD